MKKYVALLVGLFILSGFYSCKSGSSFEKDVRKRADYMCKVQKLTAKAATDESAAKDLENVKKEMDTFDEQMEKKYKDQKPDSKQTEKAQAIMADVMAKCK
jgi:formate-dependent nitrite reductase cytochrome c552 subunit